MATKQCSKCDKDLPIEMFNKHGEGRRPDCRECQSARMKVYTAKPNVKARKKQQAADWYKQNRAVHLESVREYLEKHRAEKNAYNRNWRRQNPEKAKVIDAVKLSNRRSRLKAGGVLTAKEWHDICSLYENRCLACGSKGKLTLDHVLPLALGGSNTAENIQPLCLPCNTKKGVRHIDYRYDWNILECGGML